MIEEMKKMLQAGEAFRQILREQPKSGEGDNEPSGLSPELSSLYIQQLEIRLSHLRQDRKQMLERMDSEIEQMEKELAQAKEPKTPPRKPSRKNTNPIV